MTEIRPIRAAEAEGFLELLCEAFALDLNRAHDVFFSEPMFDLERKWALFEGREMVSILTTTPLEFGWGRAFGVAGVCTRPARQGEGHASRLLQRVLRESERRGEAGALLFARDTKLYERNGFQSLDRAVRAELRVEPHAASGEPIPFEEVVARYTAWSQAHPDRLRRDVRRWGYWQWHYRVCFDYVDGYLCPEASVLREAIYDTPAAALPLPRGCEWFGLAVMADTLELPLASAPSVELILMGRGVPGQPQMFLTDQF